MEIENIAVEKLIPYEFNNKVHDETQVNRIANSIKEFWFLQPIVIDKDNVIIVWHGRLEWAKKLWLKEVPCVRAENLTETQIKKYRILDNKLNESEWNTENLKMELQEIGDLNIWEIEISIEDMFPDVQASMINAQNITDDADNVPEAQTAKIVRGGDLFSLGWHRLLCGDSTNEQDVETLMWWIQADLLFTDPPYNVNVSNSQWMTIENDNMQSSEFYEFLNWAFKCAGQSLKEWWSFYIRYADSEAINFRLACVANWLLVKQTLIRVKNWFNRWRQDYKRKHEPCLYWWKEWAWHYFVDLHNISTVFEDIIDVEKMRKEDMKALIREIMSDKVPTTIIHENKPLINDLHPTMKPIKICWQLITNSSKENEIVLDLFGWSWSTMIACEQLKRKCYMMEYDPKYAEVIIKRFHNLNPNAEIKCLNRDIDIKDILQ